MVVKINVSWSLTVVDDGFIHQSPVTAPHPGSVTRTGARVARAVHPRYTLTFLRTLLIYTILLIYTLYTPFWLTYEIHQSTCLGIDPVCQGKCHNSMTLVHSFWSCSRSDSFFFSTCSFGCVLYFSLSGACPSASS